MNHPKSMFQLSGVHYKSLHEPCRASLRSHMFDTQVGFPSNPKPTRYVRYPFCPAQRIPEPQQKRASGSRKSTYVEDVYGLECTVFGGTADDLGASGLGCRVQGSGFGLRIWVLTLWDQCSLENFRPTTPWFILFGEGHRVQV